ncbi:MAG: helix-turn-helix transcriptional regulator [Peptococcaceae bacterium]|nr:helix-turn-helix transcriptional regulator [Peptococcaceae bacterium]
MHLHTSRDTPARKTGIRQSNISRIENGNCSPTIATLQQIADGVGKTLHIEFR